MASQQVRGCIGAWASRNSRWMWRTAGHSPQAVNIPRPPHSGPVHTRFLPRRAPMSERPIRERLLATHDEDRAHRVQPQGMRGQTGRSGHRPLGRCAGGYRCARESTFIAPTPIFAGDALMGRKLGVLHTGANRHSPTAAGRARHVAERWKADETAGMSSALTRRPAGSASTSTSSCVPAGSPGDGRPRTLRTRQSRIGYGKRYARVNTNGSAVGRGDGARHSLCIGRGPSHRCILCLSARRGVLPHSRSEAAAAACDRPAVLFEHMLMRVLIGNALGSGSLAVCE